MFPKAVLTSLSLEEIDNSSHPHTKHKFLRVMFKSSLSTVENEQ